MDDRVLHHAFVCVLFIPDVQLLHVDEVQKIFIFECVHRPESLFRRRECAKEIVGQISLMMKIVAGDARFQFFHGAVFFCTVLNIKQAFVNFFYFPKDDAMMRKPDLEKRFILNSS